MLSYAALEQFLFNLPAVRLDYPFDEQMAVFWIDLGSQVEQTAAMFALVKKDSQPVQVSLRCDPRLARTLRDRYDEVLPGQNLNKKHWNTLVCSGQLTNDEIFDLVRHSYQLTRRQQEG